MDTDGDEPGLARHEARPLGHQTCLGLLLRFGLHDCDLSHRLLIATNMRHGRPSSIAKSARRYVQTSRNAVDKSHVNGLRLALP